MDLHVHTCLSPCADDGMTPAAVVAQAAGRGLDAIGVTDHNAWENVMAAREAGRRAGVAVLGGMEVTSSEEAHLLVLFDDEGALEELGARVAASLDGANDPAFFGEQLVVDADGRLAARCGRLLAGSTTLTLAEIVAAAHALGGIAIASHVDRPSLSIPSQLGFIPGDLDLDGVELSARAAGLGPARRAELTGSRPWSTASDAHRLDEIGAVSTGFLVAGPTVAELRLAFRGAAGRRIEH